MAIATYHKHKLYIPKEVEKILGIESGDQTEIRILDDRSFSVYVKRKTNAAEQRITRRILEKPFTGKLVRKHLKRNDYYK